MPDRSQVLRPGLCSVTLRAESAELVAATAARAGLMAIEWGADVHAPPGDVARALEAGWAHGVAVASYGSYFRAGCGEDFAPVLAAARALGAPRVRVWAGERASGEVADRSDVVSDLRRCADKAAPHGIQIGLEFHGGTLTDTAESTARLLDEVDRAGVRTYWQPPIDADDDEALAGFAQLESRVCAVHAFSWGPGTQRHPLEARAALWSALFRRIQASGRAMDVLLEFVADDDIGHVESDAETVIDLIRTSG